MKKAARTFQDLIVWQKSHEFVLLVYKLESYFLKGEFIICRRNYGDHQCQLSYFGR